MIGDYTSDRILQSHMTRPQSPEFRRHRRQSVEVTRDYRGDKRLHSLLSQSEVATVPRLCDRAAESPNGSWRVFGVLAPFTKF